MTLWHRRSRLWIIAGILSAALTVLVRAIASGTAAAQIVTPIAVPPEGGELFHPNLLQAIFLGFVQGMTEFLPISSTAHLKVVPVALRWGDPGVTFTAVIQLGSIAAVLWYFWADLQGLIQGATQAIARRDYRSHDFRIVLGIILGTLPIVFFGLLIKRLIPDFDHSWLRSTVAIALASIVMALLLGASESLTQHKRNFDHLTSGDGIFMGLAQALALIPGVSRSGSTLTAGLFMGLERATAARFSFLLGIPAITLAGLVELREVVETGFGETGVLPLVAGVISAAVFSYLTIAWLLRYLQTQSTWIFVWYRLLFGALILGAVGAGWLPSR